jgi:hypothetical protein
MFGIDLLPYLSNECCPPRSLSTLNISPLERPIGLSVNKKQGEVGGLGYDSQFVSQTFLPPHVHDPSVASP